MSDSETAAADVAGKETATDEPEIVVSQHVAAPPDVLFEYLVDPEKMLRWLGVAVDIEPTPGGKFWFNANGTDSASGTYTEIDRPHRVVFTFGWDGSEAIPPGSTTVAITLTAAADDTTDLELRHSGLPVDLSGDHGDGWTYFVGRLAIAATGADPGQNRHAPPS